MSQGRLHEVSQQDPRDKILWLTAPPLIWAIHFLASYLTAAIWCAKFAGDDGDASEVRIAIAMYTVVALLIIAALGWASYRRHRMGGSPPPHDFPSQADRRRFLGYSAFLLALLSAVATIFTALVVAFVGSCH